MPPPARQAVAECVPKGYDVIPVSSEQVTASLRIGVLVRKEPDPAMGQFVVVRDTVDARVLLGAIIDTAGRVHQWIEVWVQNLEGLTRVVPAYVEALSNAVLDQRWQDHVASFDQLDQTSIISAGWESVHPSPTFLDLDALGPVHPVDPQSNHPWELCQDDTFLDGKKLPRYGTSLHRYLYLSPLGGQSPVVAVTPDAPTNDGCWPMSKLTESIGGRLLALNPGGGLMMVRPFAPIGFDSFVDLLGGGSWEGVKHGQSSLNLGLGMGPSQVSAEGGEQRLSDGWMFMASSGRWGRLIEAMHLKLRLLGDTVAAVRSITSHTQHPLFNLVPDSFHISLGQQGSALPFLWAFKNTLVDPGAAIALPIHTSDYQYYMPGRVSAASIYHPQTVSQSVQAQGALRIRQVLEAAGGLITLEGTLTTQEKITPGRNDLAWLRMTLATGRVDLYAHLDREAAMAAGEWRFRTIAQKLPKDTQEALHGAEGVLMPDAPFEIVPLLSSPCDLYALGVLAVRTLLVDKDTKLSVALDEVLSLARQVGVDQEGSTDLKQRIESLFNKDERWIQSLGPHRLTHEELEPQDAFDVIPPQLWWSVLAMIVRMFPGTAPDCPCRDFGDAPQGGIHKIYDPVVESLDGLLLRTRSLIVIDWRFNREVHTVLRRHMTGAASG